MSFAQENALLWEVSKKKSKTSYLFGTIHSQDPRVISFAQEILPYLYECSAYAGEIIMDPGSALAMMPYLFEKDKSKQCKNVLSEKEYDQVENMLIERLGEGMTFLLPYMSPYMTALIMSVPHNDPDKPLGFLDIYLQEKADSMQFDLISLESIEGQFTYIQTIDIEAQKAHLLKLLDEKEDIDDALEEITMIYLSQDLKAMAKELQEAGREDPLFSDQFMIERNLIHAEGMMETMKEQKTFTAVGAAHLPGETGILQLLQNEGYKIRAVLID